MLIFMPFATMLHRPFLRTIYMDDKDYNHFHFAVAFAIVVLKVPVAF